MNIKPATFADFLLDFNKIRATNAPSAASPTRKQGLMTRFDYSAQGHLTTLDSVYRAFWGEDCKVIDMTGSDNAYDTKVGVDYIVEVRNPDFQSEMDIWVQERFRKPQFQKYQSITLIESNTYSGNLSEIYKSKAQFLVYGYYDDKSNTLLQAVVVDMGRLLNKLACRKIDYSIIPNNQTNQKFLSVDFSELRKHGLIEFELNNS